MKKITIKILYVSTLMLGMILLNHLNVMASDSVKKLPNIEVLDGDTLLNKNSVKDNIKNICKSFMPENADETTTCLQAIEGCAAVNEEALRTVLNYTVSVVDPCSYYPETSTPEKGVVPARWLCSYNRWKTIKDDVKKGISYSYQTFIAGSCAAEELNVQNLGKTQGTIPADPAAKEASKDSAGGLKPDADSSDTPDFGKYVGAGDTGCAMNPLAFGNIWSGFVSFLPYFMLMLVFGMKRGR